MPKYPFFRSCSSLAFAALVLSRALVAAPAGAYVLEKAGSQIKFQVKSRLKVIEGVFENWDGEIKLEPSRLETLQLKVQAQSASIKTGSTFEEILIRGENFFAAEKYPEVLLVSKKITAEGAGRFRMEGDLTLRGTTHPVAIPFVAELNGEAGGQLQGEFEFKRQDFGITYNMTLNPIEDLVKVIVTLKVRAPGEDPPKDKGPTKN